MTVKQGVITADIVASTTLPNEVKEWLYTAIEAYLEQVASVFELRKEWYRGDSFQVKIKDVQQALKLALLIKTYIRSLQFEGGAFNGGIFDTRMVLGIGTVDFERAKIMSSDGEAFQLSGRMLDQLKTGKQFFSVVSNDTYAGELQMESLLLDTIISGTTALQCEVINRKLQGQTEVAIAEALGIKQSAVNQRSGAGNWHVFAAMTDHFEQLYAHG